jgi:hypothetical protein
MEKLPVDWQSSTSSKGDSQTPRFLVEHTLDTAGDAASRNSSSLNTGAGGKERLSVVAAGGFTHVADESSRAIFENELDNDNERGGSRESRFFADRTFLRPRKSSGRAARLGDPISSRGSRLGCRFSAPVSEKESKLDEYEEDDLALKE